MSSNVFKRGCGFLDGGMMIDFEKIGVIRDMLT
jgi:hypothetical protein